jgi:hypothetical protein
MLRWVCGACALQAELFVDALLSIVWLRSNRKLSHQQQTCAFSDTHTCGHSVVIAFVVIHV